MEKNYYYSPKNRGSTDFPHDANIHDRSILRIMGFVAHYILLPSFSNKSFSEI